jgi:hypothetical protein
VGDRNASLATIHIAKKQLGFDEEAYRDLLEGITGKRSAKDMDPREHTQVIREMERLGFKVESRHRKPRKYDDLGHRPGMASPAQMRKTEVLWHDVCKTTTPTASLRRWLFHYFQVQDIRFLTHDMAGRAIEALKSMSRRGKWQAPLR